MYIIYNNIIIYIYIYIYIQWVRYYKFRIK